MHNTVYCTLPIYQSCYKFINENIVKICNFKRGSLSITSIGTLTLKQHCYYYCIDVPNFDRYNNNKMTYFTHTNKSLL